MVSNPPEGEPRITPYLLYQDLEKAIDWLRDAFGLEERMRIPGADGKASHAEMTLADGVVMMGHPGPEYRSPKEHGHVCQIIHVYVDGVDAHYQRARSSGAKILAEPEDKFYGDRSYTVADLEGHQWSFSEHVRDVAPEDMHP